MTLELEAPELETAVVKDVRKKISRAPKRAIRPKTVALIAAVVAVVAAGTGAYLYFQNRVSTDDAQVDAHNAPVAPKISGNISEILVDDNRMVKAGQVLVRIDPRDYQAKVDQARAALAVAESNSASAHAQVPLADGTTASAVFAAESQLAAAKADYARTEADYDRASTSELAYAQADIAAKRATRDRASADLERMRPLAAKDEISQLQFDAYVEAARVADSDLDAAQDNLVNAEKKAAGSKASMLTAQAQVSAAEANLEQARANRGQVKISSAQAGSASAAIQQARANLEAAELDLSYTEIAAPIDGLVTKKTIQAGQIVQPGETMLTIVPLKDVWITANFKETQLAKVKPGQRAEVSVDMYGRSFSGVVDSLAGASGADLSLLPPENATGNYVKIVQRIPVKIRLQDMPGGFVLRPGMNVDATIFTK